MGTTTRNGRSSWGIRPQRRPTRRESKLSTQATQFAVDIGWFSLNSFSRQCAQSWDTQLKVSTERDRNFNERWMLQPLDTLLLHERPQGGVARRQLELGRTRTTVVVQTSHISALSSGRHFSRTIWETMKAWSQQLTLFSN